MSYRRRRLFGILITLAIATVTIFVHPASYEPVAIQSTDEQRAISKTARSLLEDILVKGRAPKTGYSRSQFTNDWLVKDGCDMRNIILHRDLTDTKINERCQVVSGTLLDPYTGNEIKFVRGERSSQAIQIDHVVALSNAWQTGAQQLSVQQRQQFANDPLELLAVDGPTNEEKRDGDAATWLPPNKSFRCQYVERQIRIKHKYELWVTPAERDAMIRVLDTCDSV